MSNKNIQNVNFILDRIKKAYKMDTDMELAGFLDRAKNTISAWRHRNTLDYELIITKCDDLSLHWVMFGVEPIFRKDLMSPIHNPPAGGREDQILSDYEQQVEEIVHKIEHGPFSQRLKLRVIDSLLQIVDEEFEPSQAPIDSVLSDRNP